MIVVDDGSTDGTSGILNEAAARDARIKILTQSNQGHLASLNRGIAEATGDIIFLLDGDDTYDPTHVASCCKVFRQMSQIELVCTAYRIFGDHEDLVRRHRNSGRLGDSAIAAMTERYWAVGPTSCLALRASLARCIFPYPPHWLTHEVQTGEAGLVLGASILGAREYFLSEATVNYRAHGTNFDLGRRQSPAVSYRITRLSCEIVEHFRVKAGLPMDFSEQALSEFQTWTYPGRRELNCYARIIWRGRRSFLKRCEMVLRAFRHYRGTQ